jgi:hypothetical protein
MVEEMNQSRASAYSNSLVLILDVRAQIHITHKPVNAQHIKLTKQEFFRNSQTEFSADSVQFLWLALLRHSTRQES